MQNRLKSPVLWGGIVSAILTEVTALSQIEAINGWTVAISILTTLASIFAIINNPTDSTKM